MDETEPSTIPSKRNLALLATAALSTVVLLAASGCSGSGEESAPSGGPTGGGGAIVTGSASCDRAAMEEAVASWSKAYGGDERTTLPGTSGSYRCADGWAVAFPETGAAGTEVTVTAVFEAEGQFWIPKDRAKVCGDTASDSEVPASLFRDACQTN